MLQLKRNRMTQVLSIIVATAFIATATADTQAPFIRIAKTGDPAPGEPQNTIFAFGDMGIDDMGNVAFRGGVTGPGIDGRNTFRIWHGNALSYSAIAVQGPAPEFGKDARLTSFSRLGLSHNGQVNYQTRVIGDGITEDNRLLYAGSPSSPELALRSGSPPPGIEPGLNLGMFSAENGPQGHLVIRGDLFPDGGDETIARGIWAGLPGDFRLVARSGGHAPGTPDGVVFTTVGSVAHTITINNRGMVAFPSFIEGNGLDETNNTGIWAGTADDLSLVMRAGDPAPGIEPGVNFIGRPDYAVINGNDRVLFQSLLTGPGIDASNNAGLWMSRPGQPHELIAREGDPVPVLGDAFTTTGIYPYFSTEDDRVALVPSFDGPGVTPENDQAILFGDIGNLEIVFREGDQAPGLPPGVLIDLDDRTPLMAFRETGAAALILSLTGAGVDESNDRALFWRESEDAAWLAVAREGELFDGNIVAEDGLVINVGGGGAGGSQNINDDGLLAIIVRFEGIIDGAYIVPSPSAIWLFAMIAPIVRRVHKL